MEMQKIAELRKKANTLPMEPGVYLMRDRRGEIIYVGKAKKLKNRVTSYFRGVEHHLPKVYRMVEQVQDFDYIVTDSEFEALVLECSLIKLHSPKYNILLKDDKGYHYVCVTKEPYPRIKLAMQKADDGNEYIGPFVSSMVVKQTVEEANRVFLLPTCRRKFPEDFGKERPCLNFHIHQCMGVCRGKITPEAYREVLDEALQFIRSGGVQSVEVLTERMQQAAEALDFERAARYRDRISAIRRITEQQKVIEFPHESLDVLGWVQGEDKIYCSLLVLREGRLRDKKDFSFDCMAEPEEIVTEFLLSYYMQAEAAPAEVFLDRELPDRALLEQLLREHRGKKIQFTVPQRGESRKLCQMAQNNAAQELARDTNRTGREIAALTELGRLLGLSHPPDYIEAFDISNIGGSTIVGGMTVFRRGRPEKRLYKKFTIRDMAAPDDYAAMEQMLTRRLTHYKEAAENGKKDGFETLPDLWLIDGGAGQVAAAKKAAAQFGVELPIFGMVKDDRHRTRAIRAENEEIAIRSSQSVFRLITAIQDETHRYAISFSRKKHRKTGFASVLTGVPGIGEQRAAKLLKHFKSMAAVKAADEEALAAAPGMTRPAAEALYRYLHPADGEPAEG
mgnify:FL=1